MNIDIPENKRVIEFLTREGNSPLLTAPQAAGLDPYTELGSHPDVVEWLWDYLGAGLGPSAKQIVCGVPALVEPNSAQIIALAYGTQYVIWLGRASRPEARQAEYETKHSWSDGRSTDLGSDLGQGWYFGRWSQIESEWLGIAPSDNERDYDSSNPRD